MDVIEWCTAEVMKDLKYVEERLLFHVMHVQFSIITEGKHSIPTITDQKSNKTAIFDPKLRLKNILPHI